MALAALVCGSALALAACGDPVQDQAIQALGPESPYVPPGPLHRVGQPCLLCHKQGGRATPFSVAGTVYVDRTAQKVANGVTVFILDAANGVHSATTNCVGNFYVLPEEFTPTYPMWVTLRAGTVQRDMDSASYREGSCAACHVGARGPGSPGPVYLIDIDNPGKETPPPSCN